jgi:hypothetical protein
MIELDDEITENARLVWRKADSAKKQPLESNDL